MHTRKTLFLLTTLIGLTLATPLPVPAARSDSLTVENHIQTGDINIQLKEYQVNSEGKESIYDYSGYVLPGDTISKIPRITNLAEPCYIRVLLTFSELTNPELTGLTAENLQGISEKWVQIGDYYYYPDVLATGDTLDFFQSIHIPSEFENAYAKQELSISIQVDAIQAKNFTPDFSSTAPWGNQIIEICAHNQAEPTISNPYTSMYVEYEGNAHKLITASDDFFSNLGQMMPGDTLSDEIVLKNTTSSDAQFFFHTELPENLSEEALDLLEQISLTIVLEDKLLYEGNLKSTALEDIVSLGTYKSGETAIFKFTLFMPETLTNAYALRETAVKWIFSVENDELTIITPSPVKTGDTQNTGHYILLLLLSAFMFGTFSIYKTRKENDASC